MEVNENAKEIATRIHEANEKRTSGWNILAKNSTMGCLICKTYEIIDTSLLCRACSKLICHSIETKNTYQMLFKKRVQTLKKRAEQNAIEKNNTIASNIAYTKIKDCTSHVKREVVMVPYIVDMYLPKKNIVIEIDGGIHDKQFGYDDARDEFLTRCHGVRVFRFTNDDVINGFFDDSLDDILTHKNLKRKIVKQRSSIYENHHLYPTFLSKN